METAIEIKAKGIVHIRLWEKEGEYQIVIPKENLPAITDEDLNQELIKSKIIPEEPSPLSRSEFSYEQQESRFFNRDSYLTFGRKITSRKKAEEFCRKVEETIARLQSSS